jgi:putative addiction module component (TIGR02574 family)
MDYLSTLESINSMSVVDRIRLIQDVLEGIATENDDSEPEDLKQDLDRRIAEDDANPQEGMAWEVVKAQARARWKK